MEAEIASYCIGVLPDRWPKLAILHAYSVSLCNQLQHAWGASLWSDIP